VNLIAKYKPPVFTDAWHLDHIRQKVEAHPVAVSYLTTYLRVHAWRLIAIDRQHGLWLLHFPFGTAVSEYTAWYTVKPILALCLRGGTRIETWQEINCNVQLPKLTIIGHEIGGIDAQ